MSFYLNNDKILDVTPAKAEEYLKFNNLPQQRPLDAKWVRELLGRMRDGIAIKGDIAFAINRQTKEVFQVNGQHFCNSVILFQKPVRAIVSYYDCDSDLDISNLYRQFDSHKIRTLPALVKVEMAALGLQWRPFIGSLIASGASLCEYGIPPRSTITKNDRANLLRHYRAEGDFLEDLLRGQRKSFAHLKRTPVIAALIASYRKHKPASLIFWQSILDGASLGKNDPRLKLREYLRNTSMRGGQTSDTDKRLATQKEIYSKCIIAFNAYKKGLPTDLKYYRDKPIPKIV